MMILFKAHPLLVVRDDAANKIGVRVSQRGHQLGQLLLVQLSHSTEHALLGLVGGTERRLVHSGNLVQTDDSINWTSTVRWKEEEEISGLTQGEIWDLPRWHDTDIVD